MELPWWVVLGCFGWFHMMGCCIGLNAFWYGVLLHVYCVLCCVLCCFGCFYIADTCFRWHMHVYCVLCCFGCFYIADTCFRWCCFGWFLCFGLLWVLSYDGCCIGMNFFLYGSFVAQPVLCCFGCFHVVSCFGWFYMVSCFGLLWVIWVALGWVASSELFSYCCFWWFYMIFGGCFHMVGCFGLLFIGLSAFWYVWVFCCARCIVLLLWVLSHGAFIWFALVFFTWWVALGKLLSYGELLWVIWVALGAFIGWDALGWVCFGCFLYQKLHWINCFMVSCFGWYELL